MSILLELMASFILGSCHK